MTGAEAKEVAEGGIVIEKDSQRSFLEADTIVLATGYQANTNLLDRLKKSPGVGEVYTVGDCVEPRKAIDAIHDGFRIGHGI
jgi:2,4-dienoyl-CoA reductase (NADPH2)